MTLELVTTLLTSACQMHVPEHLSTPQVLHKLTSERKHFDALAADPTGTPVYGLNTLTGHRDNERVAPDKETELQVQMLRSHQIPPATTTCYDDLTTRCIGLCKAYTVATGGTGMSPALYRHLLNAIEAADFHPRIPVGQSYSSGDVIPAAHWSAQLLGWRDYLRKHDLLPGEGMALINGSFVHLGLATANLPALQRCAEYCTWAMAHVAALSGAPVQTFERALPPAMTPGKPLIEAVVRHVAAMERPGSPPTQVAVSIRGAPETLLAQANATSHLATQVDAVLTMPSGNPLYDATSNHMRSQGSFLAPSISLAQSAMIEALLLTGWALVSQVQFLLSGHVKDIPVDAAQPTDPLGMIQIPKAMMATLENLRTDCGRRCFAAGGSTSHGIEDLWTNGEILSRQVNAAARTVTHLAIRTQAVCDLITGQTGKSAQQASSATGAISPSTTLQSLQEREAYLFAHHEPLDFMTWASRPD